MMTTRGRRPGWMKVMKACPVCFKWLGSCVFAEAHDDVGVGQDGQVGSDVEIGRDSLSGFNGRGHCMPLGEGVYEGMAATGKALHCNLEKRTHDQGAFSPPSFNHGVLAIGLIVFPNCHDWEARRDKENRRVEHEAPPLVHFGPQRRDSLCADRQGTRGVVSLAA